MGAAVKVVAGGVITAAGFIPGLQFLIPVGLSLTLQGVSEALIKRPGETARGLQVTVRQSAASRRTIYGKARVGGIIIYQKPTESNNQNMLIMSAISGHIIYGVSALNFMGEAVPVPWSIIDSRSAPLVVDQATGANQYGTPTDNRLLFQVGRGDDGQDANSSLTTDSLGIWTTAHRMRGVANIYLRLNYKSEAFPNGPPNISFDVHGKPVYDPRVETIRVVTAASNAAPIVITTSVAHGYTTGDMVRVRDSLGNTAANGEWLITVLTSTTFELDGSAGNGAWTSGGECFRLVWTDNAALCAADYLVTSKIRGGFGSPYSEIDETVLIAAANICDESVTLPDSGSESRYTVNGLFEWGEPRSIIPRLAGAMAGVITYISGKWHILPGAFRTPTTITLLDKDVVAPVSMESKRSTRELFNAVKGTFVDPDNDYKDTDFPPLISSVFQAEDGGDRVYKDISLPFTNSPFMAQRLAQIDLERNRRQKSLELVCGMVAYTAQPGNVVAWTHDRFSFSGKTFEVSSFAVDLEDNALISKLLLVESDVDVYGFAVDDYGTPVDRDLAGLSNRTVPFGWSPNAVQGPNSTAATLKGITDKSFAINQTYKPAQDGSQIPKISIGGAPPINRFSPSIRPPHASLTATTASTGGFLKGGERYYIAVAGIDSGGLYTPLSEVAAVDVPAGTNTNTVKLEGITWDASNSRWFLFFGTDFLRLSGQFEYLGSPPSSPPVTLTGPDAKPTAISFEGFNAAAVQPDGYNIHALGAPDVYVEDIIVSFKKCIHLGVWGGQVVSTTATTITIAILPTLTTNELAGRYVSLVSVIDDGTKLSDGGGMDNVDLLIASNTGDVLTLTAGQVDPGTVGFKLNNVVIIRTKATSVGSDATGEFIEDTKFGIGGQSLADEEGGDNGLKGFVLRFIGGKAIGESHIIKDNVGDKIYIDGDWITTPDTTSVYIVHELHPVNEVVTSKLTIGEKDEFIPIRLVVPNRVGDQLLVEAFTRNESGVVPSPVRSPYREIFIQGKRGNLTTVGPQDIVSPIDDEFSWVNQGSSTVTIGYDGRIFLHNDGASGLNLRCRVKSAPSTPYSVSMGGQGISSWSSGINDVFFGIMFRETSSGKIITFYFDLGRSRLAVDKWDSPTVFNGLIKAWTGGLGKVGGNWMCWMKLEDDGTDLEFWLAPDGINYMLFLSITRASFFTTAPDEIGFVILARDGPVGMNMVHWEEL